MDVDAHTASPNGDVEGGVVGARAIAALLPKKVPDAGLIRGLGKEPCASAVLDSDWSETWVKSVKVVSVGALPASLRRAWSPR